MGVNNKRYAAFYSQLPDSVTKEQALGYLTGPIGEVSPEKMLERASILRKCYMAVQNKRVGFMLVEESAGKYRIYMFYENEYNKANGEDL